MSIVNDAPREINRHITRPLSGATMQSKTHPAIIIAAGAVTILCAVGVGVLTGVIPSAGALGGNSASSNATQSSLPPVLAAAGAAQTPLGNMVDDSPAASTSTLKPIDKPTLGQPLSRNESSVPAPTKTPAKTPTTATIKEPNQTSQSTVPVPTYQATASSSTVATPSSVGERSSGITSPIICNNCGTIESVNTNVEQGSGSGAGAVIGGVIGGVLAIKSARAGDAMWQR
ncbi:MAG: hypothetical protein HC782_05585 [Gammaproteobacteria bacterium]|nr:hypothetical protein [Gammaproteobacteria bacterium]